MDAFFASVEQRDNPQLRGKPVIVSGRSERSVVSTASYEARKFGIHSAMPVFTAKKRCPHLIIVPGNMAKYKQDSAKIMQVLSGISPLVEQVSIDEAYVDLKGLSRLLGDETAIANKIKQEIFDHLNLTCSIGIAQVKFLAKIASDMNKPDGLTIIPEEKTMSFIKKLSIEKVPGIGKTAMKQMQRLKIKTLGDLQPYPASVLKAKFGKMGTRLHELCNGVDTSVVEPFHERKSISSETTLSEDISDPGQICRILLDRSQVVGNTLRKKELICKTVFIKLKFFDFTQITRSRTLDTEICSSTAIYKQALKLFEQVRLTKAIRLAGVGVSSLKDMHSPVQMSLLEGVRENTKQWESVDHAVDGILEKFGSGIVKKAALNPSKKTRKKE